MFPLRNQKYTTSSWILHLRNEFDFWKDHGIMNTSVSCKVSEAQVKPKGLHIIFARDPNYSWFHELPKIEFITYIYILL